MKGLTDAMTKNIHEIITQTAATHSSRPALHFKQQTLTYTELEQGINNAAAQLLAAGVQRFDRVAVYLPKQFETVLGLFGASKAGAVFVPVNPALKAAQVAHILTDCNVRVLITSSDRLQALKDELRQCTDLHTVLLTDEATESHGDIPHVKVAGFTALKAGAAVALPAELTQHYSRTDADMAAILYTSGSTGKPKGVVLSHRNMLCGAHSVASYLHNTDADVLLALLPLSFDYGLSQLTTAFLTGASVVLLDFFLVQDVVRAVAQHGVTGIAAVPPLWAQLAKANWTAGCTDTVRYLTNSGGAMPLPLLAQLQQVFHRASPYLMYGLTEAFRSTYLPPEQLDKRPGSMGKAIPNAEIVVVREDGSLCGPNEPGELVHRGPLVSLGYWNAPEKTAERFKPDPVAPKGIQLPQMAVFSGDTVKYDEEGFLYFIGRRDEMIKTSGYRVSPTEVEEAVYALSNQLVDVAAIGAAHPDLDQAIVVLLACKDGFTPDLTAWQQQLKRRLPNFMQPKAMLVAPTLPKNANGKIDRKLLADQYKNYFTEASQ